MAHREVTPATGVMHLFAYPLVPLAAFTQSSGQMTSNCEAATSSILVGTGFMTKKPTTICASMLVIVLAAVSVHAQPYTIGGRAYLPGSPAETVTVSFMTAEGGATINNYSGFVRIVVSGTGRSCTPAWNDAFYIYDWQPGCSSSGTVPFHDPWYYQLTFDTQPLVPLNVSRDAKNFIYYDINTGLEVLARPYVPAYRGDHTYSFIINTGLASAGPLHFGVSDGGFSDNAGSYQVQVTQLVEGASPVQVTSFGASGTPPFIPGSSVTFTANATGGDPPLQYQFWIYRDGAGWSLLQGYSTSNQATWTASPAGTYSLQVWVRSAGSSAAYEAWRSYGPFDVRALPLEVISLAADVTFPILAGTPVTWTALTTGGAGPYTYQFWLFNGSTWSIGRDWSTTGTWTWTPGLPGSYVIQVWVRNTGSGNSYDAWRAATATVTTPAVLTVTAVTANPVTAPAGASVTWTAYAAGGAGPYTYRFFVFDGVRWTVGQEWSSSNSWTWVPPTPGSYVFQVWVRQAGSSGLYDAWRAFGPYTATKPSALTVTELIPTPPGPVPAGTPVTWKASAAGGSPPYTYKFWVFDGVSWTLQQDWSSARTWTGVPLAAGNYAVQVWARNNGSETQYDAWRGAEYAVSAPHPLEVTGAAADPAFPVPAGTPVTWTARASGGTGPYTFKFWVFNGASWSVGQDWSAANTWTWVPADPGAYWIQVWARNDGSTSLYDAWAPFPATVSGATSLSAPSVSLSPMSPLVAGAPALITAKAQGGTGPYTFQFWIFNGTSWNIGQAWSAANTFTWTPSAQGTYYIQVWVRNAGSVALYDQWSPLGPLTVIP